MHSTIRRNRVFGTRPSDWLVAILFVAPAIAPAALMGDEIRDVTFSTPYAGGVPTTADFHYDDKAIGKGRDGFQAIVDRIGKLPAGTSIVWGPDYGRCGACSGREPPCVAKFLYPELWKQLEAHVANRGLTLSSLYPSVGRMSIGTTKRDAVATISWCNFRGPDTPHDEVLYLDGAGLFAGRGDEGFDRILMNLDRLPIGSEIAIPNYEYGGRWAFENFSEDQLKAESEKIRDVVPFAARRREFDAKIAARKLQLKAAFPPIQLLAKTPRTVLDWSSSGKLGHAFVSFGRIIRHDERPRPPAARLSWTGYDPAAISRARQVESTATYKLDDVEIGQGVAGFARAMKKLESLPVGSVVHVNACLRTKGPFTCPLIYEGRRHFERTGFEPCIQLFPWLIDVAKKGRLEIEWIPDELKSCGDCELNR